nr:NS3a [Japanaut virus]
MELQPVKNMMFPSAPRPPSYADYTVVSPGVGASLNILNNAMSNTTGASNAMKEEKTAFGAAAEAMRDDEVIRDVKVCVAKKILPRLYTECTGLRRKRCLTQGALTFVAIIACASSMITFAVDMNLDDVVLGTNTNETSSMKLPSWFKGITGFMGVVNMCSTGMMLALGRYERVLSEKIAMLRKEITKKESYMDAVSMGLRGSINLDTINHGIN